MPVAEAADWTFVLPPAIAIGLALWLRAVIPAIFFGIWVGMIGGMVGVISRNGGMHGVVNIVMRWANTVRQGDRKPRGL